MAMRKVEKMIKVLIWCNYQLTHEIKLEETKEEFHEKIPERTYDGWLQLSSYQTHISVRTDAITSMQIDVIV